MTRYRITPGEGQSTELLMDASEAMDQVASGKTEFTPQQSDPPFELIELLESLQLDRGSLGPRTDQPELLGKITQRAVAGGVRQCLVDGYELDWHEWSTETRQRLWAVLEGRSTDRRCLLQQAVDMMDHARNQSRRFDLGNMLTEEQQRSEGVVDVPSSGFINMDYPFEYSVVGPDWRCFYERLQTVRSERDAILFQAAAEGRILCCEDSGAGSRILPPSKAGDVVLDTEIDGPIVVANPDKAIFLMLSSDLPKAWFGSREQTRQRMFEMVEWFQRAGIAIHRAGRRASSRQLKEMARDKFREKQAVIDEAWNACQFPDKGVRGSIPGRYRISSKEIKDLIQ